MVEKLKYISTEEELTNIVNEYGSVKLNNIEVNNALVLRATEEIKCREHEKDGEISYYYSVKGTVTTEENTVAEISVSMSHNCLINFIKKYVSEDEALELKANLDHAKLQNLLEKKPITGIKVQFSKTEYKGKYPQFMSILRNQDDFTGERFSKDSMFKSKETSLDAPKNNMDRDDIIMFTEPYVERILNAREENKAIDLKNHFVGVVLAQLRPELVAEIASVYDDYVKDKV